MTTIYEAMAGVMRDVSSVKKADRNEQQRFLFRGIDAVINAVGPALRTHKVIVSPRVDSIEHGTVMIGQGDKQRPMANVRVLVTYTFYGPDGDSLTAQAPGEAMDAGDKATPKAMSVAYRTALLQSLALPTDEPDPDHTAYERSAPATPSRPQQVMSAAHREALRPPQSAPTVTELLTAAQAAANPAMLDRIASAAKEHLSEADLGAVRDVVIARRTELAELAERAETGGTQ